ncbi:MAG: hypothetical protein H8D78_12590 [Chloroflexi bacterium]|nr:hypothetical protein [Chloroflexota bacterium]
MRIVADSNVLVYALHVPTNPAARRRHARAVTLFASFISGSNALLVPSTVVIEVAAALSRMVGRQFAEVNVNDLISVASEIYPLSPSLLQTWLLSLGSQGYLQACLGNALAHSRVAKDMDVDSNVPGFTPKRDEECIGQYDFMVS